MRTYLAINVILIIFAFLLTFYKVFYTEGEKLSRQVNIFQQKLKSSDQAVKIMNNESEEYFCWLSNTGDLHSISSDTTEYHYFPDSDLAWKNVTFIEDFDLNSANDSIYFTDLMDLSSGKSAIKVSDRRGKNLRTLALLPGEIPYRICLSPSENMLFYLAKNERQGMSFRLRFINLQNGRKGTLYASGDKIESLMPNRGNGSISIEDRQKGHLIFATDLQSILVLAEARQ